MKKMMLGVVLAAVSLNVSAAKYVCTGSKTMMCDSAGDCMPFGEQGRSFGIKYTFYPDVPSYQVCVPEDGGLTCVTWEQEVELRKANLMVNQEEGVVIGINPENEKFMYSSDMTNQDLKLVTFGDCIKIPSSN